MTKRSDIFVTFLLVSLPLVACGGGSNGDGAPRGGTTGTAGAGGGSGAGGGGGTGAVGGAGGVGASCGGGAFLTAPPFYLSASGAMTGVGYVGLAVVEQSSASQLVLTFDQGTGTGSVARASISGTQPILPVGARVWFTVDKIPASFAFAPQSWTFTIRDRQGGTMLFGGASTMTPPFDAPVAVRGAITSCAEPSNDSCLPGSTLTHQQVEIAGDTVVNVVDGQTASVRIGGVDYDVAVLARTTTGGSSSTCADYFPPRGVSLSAVAHDPAPIIAGLDVAGRTATSVSAGPRRADPGDEDWAQLAYSPINTSSTTARVPDQPIPLFDTVVAGEIAYTTPVVGDGRLFYELYPGGMVALNAGTGALLWQQEDIGRGKYGTAAFADGRVFTVSYVPPSFTVTLVALDAATGSVLWSVPGAFSGIIKVDGGRIYMTLDHVVAIDAATGAIVWEATEPCNSPPAIHGDRVYCVGADEVIALDAADGTLVYAAPSPPSSAVSAPAVSDGSLFYVGARLYARSISNGAPLWDADFGAFNRPVNGGTWMETSPAVAYGKVFVVGSRGVFAIDAGTGATVWRADAPSTFQPGTSVAVADGRVLLSGGAMLDANDGRSLWSATAGRIPYSTPIITDGHFYGGIANHIYGWGGQVPGVAPAY